MAGNVRQYLPPEVGDKLLCDLCQRDVQLARLPVPELNGQVTKSKEKRKFVAGREPPLGEQTLNLEKKLDLAFGAGRHDQYRAFSGKMRRIPPRGSVQSPDLRGITWMWACSIVCPAAGPSFKPILKPS